MADGSAASDPQTTVRHDRELVLEVQDQSADEQQDVASNEEIKVVVDNIVKDDGGLKQPIIPLPESSQPSRRPSQVFDDESDAESSSSETTSEESECERPAVQSPFPHKPSAAELEWRRQKEDEGAESKEIDGLFQLVGQEEVKYKFLAIAAQIDVGKRQKIAFQKERRNIVFQGNPGTGKTTVARIYASYLFNSGCLSGAKVVETSGAKLAAEGPSAAKDMIDYLASNGGVLFVDEAYQLVSDHSMTAGRQILDIILTEMENHIGRLVIIFAGYNTEMESFFEHNPGLVSRVPYTLQFTDFNEAELWTILRDNIDRKYQGRMKIEDGMDGLYMRIVVRRLARCRGTKGFGNARQVENLLARIAERQAVRIWKERRSNMDPDYYLFTKEDLLGPDPSVAKFESEAWKKLQSLIGLDEVKKAVEDMIGMIETNYRRDLAEKHPLQFSLNRVFVGSPGTGKTTVAKLYGRILADLGLLSNGEVIVKNPADFIGECLGKSEAKTKRILQRTLGKVLIIDEAYMLNSGKAESQQDHYRAAVIDTLVAEVQGVPGDDRCILMLGYEDKINAMFQHANPGLSRRFAADSPIRFMDFQLPQLEEILRFKMKQQDLRATPEAFDVASQVLERTLMRPNFANAGEVDTFLDRAKLSYQNRQDKKPVAERNYDTVFEPEDFDPNISRGKNAIENCQKLLQGQVAQEVVDKVVEYLILADNARQKGWSGTNLKEIIPMNFIFKGPPGTGKTTTARSMGKVYYDMGFLSTDEVVECSASDLIGQYVGQTSPKARAVLERGLGKVLFVDQAYLLAEGQFATEAVNELLSFLTSSKYMGKMVVILAGYTVDINNLLKAKQDLSGVFDELVVFRNIEPRSCLALLDRQLTKRLVDAPVLRDESTVEYRKLYRLFEMILVFPSWCNARDITILAKQMAASVFRKEPPTSTLTFDIAVTCLKKMISEKYQLTPSGTERPKTPQPQAPGMCPVAYAPPPALSQAPMATDMDASMDSDPGHSTTLAACAKPRQERRTDHRSQGNLLQGASSGIDSAMMSGAVDLDAARQQEAEKKAKNKNGGSIVHNILAAVKKRPAEKKVKKKNAGSAELDAVEERQREKKSEKKKDGSVVHGVLTALKERQTEKKAEKKKDGPTASGALTAVKERQAEKKTMRRESADLDAAEGQQEEKKEEKKSRKRINGLVNLRAAKERRAEKKAKEKMDDGSGLCPEGFVWIRHGARYDCAGGSHSKPA